MSSPNLDVPSKSDSTKHRVITRSVGLASKSKSPKDSDANDEKCSICIDKKTNVARLELCFHEFCYNCIYEWSKVKPICPLCKAPFSAIFYDIVSNYDYKVYEVPIVPSPASVDIDSEYFSPGMLAFRYRTTRTPQQPRSFMPTVIPPSTSFRSFIPQRHRIVQDCHDHLNSVSITATRPHPNSISISVNSVPHYPYPVLPSRNNGNLAHSLVTALSHARGLMRRIPTSSSQFDARRKVYCSGIRVSHFNSNKRRDVSQLFLQRNPTAIHRLVPFLQRELTVLLDHDVNEVLESIMTMLSTHDISSQHFYDELFPILGARTLHFIHEFRMFAISPFTVDEYDRNAVYQHPTTFQFLLASQLPNIDSPINSSIFSSSDENSNFSRTTDDHNLPLCSLNSDDNLRFSILNQPSTSSSNQEIFLIDSDSDEIQPQEIVTRNTYSAEIISDSECSLEEDFQVESNESEEDVAVTSRMKSVVIDCSRPKQTNKDSIQRDSDASKQSDFCEIDITSDSPQSPGVHLENIASGPDNEPSTSELCQPSTSGTSVFHETDPDDIIFVRTKRPPVVSLLSSDEEMESKKPFLWRPYKSFDSSSTSDEMSDSYRSSKRKKLSKSKRKRLQKHQSPSFNDYREPDMHYDFAVNGFPLSSFPPDVEPEACSCSLVEPMVFSTSMPDVSRSRTKHFHPYL